MQVGGRNTIMVDVVRCRIPLVSDIPSIKFGADANRPENGEDFNPSLRTVSLRSICHDFFLILQWFLRVLVVASQHWPELTKYVGLVCVQAHK